MHHLTLIAAVSENNVIGKDGSMPWNYPEDLKRFRKLTTGHAVLMGRKTYESILNYKGSPLENRLNIVLTSNPTYKVATDVIVVGDPATALVVCNEMHVGEVYVIGGERVYEATLPLAKKIELTEIHKEFEGDAFFPEFNKFEWKESFRENKGEYSFVTYVRK